ncbi:Granulin, partial [Stylophora pistillata]
MQRAVCCPDKIHCCPQGYTCSKDGKTCSSGSDTVASLTSTSPKALKKPLERLLDLIKGRYSHKKTLLLKHSTVKMEKISASKRRDHDKTPPIKKTPALRNDSKVEIVICPGGKSECPDGNTCCKLSTGGWGCCPLPEAVCCSDGVHCCPSGTTCDLATGTCDRNTDKAFLLKKTQVWIGKAGKSNTICPDGESQCPDGNTCCKLSSGQYGCCPLPKAVCCSDGKHCCPNGYTCHLSAGTCTQGSSSIAMFQKKPAKKRESAASNIVCPDGESECPDDTTCCKLSSGQYGCCPLPKAVCCSDGEHCCPNGYTCDISAGTCSKGTTTLILLQKLPAVQRKSDANSVVCPDGESQCPDGNTCCKLFSGQYGCCPLPKAVCCSDGKHCCPNGYTCDVSAGTCTQGSSSIAMFQKKPAMKRESAESNIVCPDGESECPDDTTCCKLSSGQYGCCPLPKAVCCSDGEHCCPNGYTCDVSPGTCSKGTTSITFLQKLPAVQRKSDANSVVCPDGDSQCPDGTTCCKLSTGQYGCCPLPNAVCCSDREHCCPNGYTCDVSAGSCTQGSSSIPMVQKLPALMREKSASNVVCPDGQSECPDGNTCCKLSS